MEKKGIISLEKLSPALGAGTTTEETWGSMGVGGSWREGDYED
jgi:hypothetical protein